MNKVKVSNNVKVSNKDSGWGKG